jgi:hypothetical protein
MATSSWLRRPSRQLERKRQRCSGDEVVPDGVGARVGHRRRTGTQGDIPAIIGVGTEVNVEPCLLHPSIKVSGQSGPLELDEKEQPESLLVECFERLELRRDGITEVRIKGLRQAGFGR